MLVNQSLSWITQTDPWHSCRKRVFHISNERTIVIGELFCPDTPHHVRTSSGVSTRSQSMSGVSLDSSTTTPADCPVEPPSKPVWPPCQGKSICCYIHNMIVLHTHTHTNTHTFGIYNACVYPGIHTYMSHKVSILRKSVVVGNKAVKGTCAGCTACNGVHIVGETVPVQASQPPPSRCHSAPILPASFVP